MGAGPRRQASGRARDARQGRRRHHPPRIPRAPHARDEALEEISWDEFFERFDQSKLAFLYQEETAGGEKSNLNRLIGRETAEAREHGATHASRHHPHGR